jgi:electron transfer flavoprotein alpha/beta subunit
MNHVVCIAHVPDTETKIKIGGDGRSIDESDVKWIVSP